MRKLKLFKDKNCLHFTGHHYLIMSTSNSERDFKIMSRYLVQTQSLTHTYTHAQKEIESTILLNHLTQHIYIVGVLQASSYIYIFLMNYLNFLSNFGYSKAYQHIIFRTGK